jgi:hypothetical protein
MPTLAGEKLEAAISYNDRRALDPTTIKRLQKIVGTKVDGELGPLTAKAVFEWQGKVGLTQDGKIGPKTLAAITSASRPEPQVGSEAPGVPRLGVWVDDSPKAVLREDYFSNLVALGFSTLAIMVHRTTAGSDRSWRPRWTAAQLEQLRALAEPRGISLGLTTWPLPSRELLGVFGRELPSLLAAAGAVALEVDTEGNWLPSRLDGYANMDEAARALVDTLREVAAPSGAQLELTTYPFHPENGSQAKVAPHMDRVFPQAYSVAMRRDKTVGWDEREGPGRLQKFSAARARSIATVTQGKTELGMGLPAYDQEFEGHSPLEALTVAWDSAADLGVTEVRYWSSKWILGHMRVDGPAGEFLLARRNGAAFRGFAPNALVHPELGRIGIDEDDMLSTRELEDMRAGIPCEEDEPSPTG